MDEKKVIDFYNKIIEQQKPVKSKAKQIGEFVGNLLAVVLWVCLIVIVISLTYRIVFWRW